MRQTGLKRYGIQNLLPILIISVLTGLLTPAVAMTGLSELTDSPDWAENAIRNLVLKYQVPTRVFKEHSVLNRQDLALALQSVIRTLGPNLSNMADATDLDTLARLQYAFKDELIEMNREMEGLERRAILIAAKNEEADQRLSLLERTQLHGDLSLGVLGDMMGRGTRNIASGHNTGKDGITDAISAIGRIRLTLVAPLHEGEKTSSSVFARSIAAFGRWSPDGAQQNNAGAFNSYNGYSRIASESAAGNEGLGASSLGNFLRTGTNLRPYLYVEDFHFQQQFKVIPDQSRWSNEIDFYAGTMSWRLLFDRSPYRGNELVQFQNNAFVNTSGTLTVNQNAPRMIIRTHQKLGSDGLSLDLGAGIGTGASKGPTSVNYEGSLNYNVFHKPGNVYGGGYTVWGTAAHNFYKGSGFGSITALDALAQSLGSMVPVNRSGGHDSGLASASTVNTAFYAGWNQEWYRGIGTTFNYFLAGKGGNNGFYNSRNQMLGAINSLSPGPDLTFGQAQSLRLLNAVFVSPRQSMTGILSIPANVLGVRHDDVMGVGYSALQLRNNALGNNFPQASRFHNAWEHTVEFYYKWAVNDAISVIPSIQLINHGLGLKENGMTTVIGLRTSYAF